jgi:Caspase domain
MYPSPETTLAIILGASKFPRSPQLSPSAAFKNSAADFASYLLKEDGFALPDSNLLDLFDRMDAAPILDEEIRAFLKKPRIEDATDLIVYFVGHGYHGRSDQFVLALGGMKEGSESISGYALGSLANMLHANASNFRRYLILDCCFSGAAGLAFQGDSLEMARQKSENELTGKDTAVLCAASPMAGLGAGGGAKSTLFSKAILETLRNGSGDLPARLSLNDVGRKTQDLIRRWLPDKTAHSQVLLYRAVGDIANLPMFPNRSLDAVSEDRSREQSPVPRDTVESNEELLTNPEFFAVAAIAGHDENAPMILGKHYTLQAGISRQVPSGFHGESVDLGDEKNIELDILVYAPTLQVLSGRWRHIIHPRDNQQPTLADFRLMPTSPEPQEQAIQVEFYYVGQLACQIEFTVRVQAMPLANVGS